jgi:hypothetical protein
MAGAGLAFSGVVMAWYGVNFVLGAGLHAYAFGEGGRGYVLSCAVLNILYVATAYYFHSMRHPAYRDAEVVVATPSPSFSNAEAAEPTAI